MAGTIIEVDPRDLSVDMNVRTDARVDDNLVASVKELGILQPPMITKTDDGYQVILGQRRTLAAVQAGLTKIPAYLVDAPEAEAARIVDQLTENDQRQPLTEAERLGGYKQLALFGLKPREIAKRLHRPKAETDRYIKVLNSTTATEALATQPITLDDAEALAEFDNEPEVQAELTKAIEAGRFSTELNKARQRREARTKIQEAEANLAAANIRIINETLAWNQRLTELASPDTPTVALTPDTHAECPGSVAYIHHDYWIAGDIVYYCEDPTTHGHIRKQYGTATLTPEEIARREAAETARAKLKALSNEAKNARAEFITQKLTATKPPADHLMLFARTIAQWEIYDSNLFTGAALLGITATEPDEILDALNRATRLQLVLPAAIALSVLEDHVPFLEERSWDEGQASAVDYLQLLTDWGYKLTDYELTLLEPPTHPDQHSDDEGDDEE